MNEASSSQSPGRTLTVSYELTLDDLREALAPRPPDQPAGKTASKAKPALRFGRGLFGWVLFIALAVMLFMLSNRTRPAGPGLPPIFEPKTPPTDIWIAVVPSALGAICVGMIVATLTLSVWVTNRRRRQGRKDTSGAMVLSGFVVSVAILGVGWWLIMNPPVDLDWRPSRWEVAAWNIVPWLIVLVLMIGLLMIARRRQIRATFETNPSLRRRHTLQIDADGIRSDDGVTFSFYRWACYRRAWETDHLLVLDDECDRRHMLPKRVLDPQQLDLARSLIGTHVADSRFSVTPGGFPIHRPAQTPIPAIPVFPAIPIDEEVPKNPASPEKP